MFDDDGAMEETKSAAKEKMERKRRTAHLQRGVTRADMIHCLPNFQTGQWIPSDIVSG